MVLFSFDEQGDFTKEKSIIAGFLYECDDEKEVLNEKKRIIQFFKKACENNNCYFPSGLHMNKNGSNRSFVGKTKSEYCRNFGRFLFDGTYDGEKLTNINRKGKYHLIVELYDTDKKEKIANHPSELVSDNSFTNLYDHMLRDFICHSLYTQSYISIDKLYIDFPTRVVKYEDDKSRFEKAGYVDAQNLEGIGKDVSKESVQSLIKTILESYSHKTINVEKFQVNSISKVYEGKNIEESAFLLLADGLNTWLTFDNSTLTPSEIEEFVKKQQVDCRCYVYSDIDELYFDAYKCAETKQYYQAICDISDIYRKDSDTKRFYTDTKLGEILDILSGTINKKDYIETVKNIYSNRNQFNSDNGKFILDLISREEAKNNKYTEEELDTIQNVIYWIETGENGNFDKISESINSERFFDTFDYLYCLEKKSADYSHFYSRFYERAYKGINKKNYARLVKTLNDNTYVDNPPKSLNFIFDQAMKIKEQLKIDDFEMNDTAYLLYDAGIGLCNHAGKTRDSLAFIDKMVKLNEVFESASDFEKKRNRHVVTYIDLLDYDMAYKIATETIQYTGHENLRVKKLSESNQADTKVHLRTKSQFAQIYSFMNKDNSRTMSGLSEEEFNNHRRYPRDVFPKIIKGFEEKGEAFEAMTSHNYYLHYLIEETKRLFDRDTIHDFVFVNNNGDAKRRKKKNIKESDYNDAKKRLAQLSEGEQSELGELVREYKKYAEKYFGGFTEPKDQLNYILDSEKSGKNIANKYALFLFLKGVIVFYDDAKIKTAFSEEKVLNSIDSLIDNSHPYELVCIYLAKIYKKYIKSDKWEEYYNRVSDFEKDNEGILKCIALNSQLEFLTANGESAKAIEIKDKLKIQLQQYTNNRLPFNDEIGNIISYTYR